MAAFAAGCSVSFGAWAQPASIPQQQMTAPNPKIILLDIIIALFVVQILVVQTLLPEPAYSARLQAFRLYTRVLLPPLADPESPTRIRHLEVRTRIWHFLTSDAAGCGAMAVPPLLD
ncbi:MAG: hypothetical protein R3F53_02670 [Gammaproteobacteria bacterium]